MVPRRSKHAARRSASCIVLAAAASLFASCGGGSAPSVAPASTPTPSIAEYIACTVTVIPVFYLAYPQSGSVGVSTSIASLVVFEGLQGGSGADYPGLQVSVTAASGKAVVTSVAPGPAPSPLPSPLATPPSLPAPSPLPSGLVVEPVAGTYQGVALPALSPGTTYSVTGTYVFATSGPCAGGTAVTPMGSFTTQ